MSARDRAICRWFAHLEAKAFFIPEGHYNIFSGTATLLLEVAGWPFQRPLSPFYPIEQTFHQTLCAFFSLIKASQ